MPNELPPMAKIDPSSFLVGYLDESIKAALILLTNKPACVDDAIRYLRRARTKIKEVDEAQRAPR